MILCYTIYRIGDVNMKKIIVGLLIFILMNLLIILSLNMNIKYITNDIIINSDLCNQINNTLGRYFNKQNLNVISDNDLEYILDDFIDATINDSDDYINYFLVNSINKKREIIKKYKISDDEIDRVIYEIEANITGSTNNIKINMSDRNKYGLVVYKYVSSIKLKNYLIVGIVICCSAIILLNKIKAFRDIGIILVLAGFLIKIACLSIDSIINNGDFIKQLGNTKISLDCFNKFIFTYIIIGIVLIIIYFIYILLNNNSSKKALN